MYRPSDKLRSVSAAVAMWAGWIYAGGIISYALIAFDTGQGKFAPQWTALSFIFSLAIAMAGTLVRSRRRFTNIIIRTFQAGFDARDVRDEEERERRR